MKVKSLVILFTLLFFVVPAQSTQADSGTLTLNKVSERQLQLEFTSFDGEKVNGVILLPEQQQQKMPVLLSLHGMMRAHQRVWQASLNGNPTIENTHKITEIALQKGMAVIALDARLHGARKDKARSVKHVLSELRAGSPELYRDMIINTIKDYEKLLEKLTLHKQFNIDTLSATGYSMGAQMAWLLAAKHPHINTLIAMVPPYIEPELAELSPVVQGSNLKETKVLLFTSTEDQYSTQSENQSLFDSIASKDKVKIVMDSDHLLPESYVNFVPAWLTLDK